MKKTLVMLGIAVGFAVLGMTTCNILSRLDVTFPEETDVPGEYVADYDLAREDLLVLKDGRFVQTVTVKSGGKTTSTTGHWKFDPLPGPLAPTGIHEGTPADRIFFNEKLMLVRQAFGELNPQYANPGPGDVEMPLQVVSGRIEMGGEEGTVYYKVSTSTK